MRDVLISLLLLFIALSAAVTASVLSVRSFDRYLAELASLPDGELPSAETVDRLCRAWEKSAVFLSVTVNYAWLSQADNAMAALRAAVYAGDLTHYRLARDGAAACFRSLKNAEGVTVFSFL